MKRLLTVVLIVCTVPAVVATPAFARVDKSYAAAVARLELDDYAEYRCEMRSSCDYTTYPELTKYDCRYSGRDGVICHGSVDMRLRPPADDPLADPELYTDYAYATVRVRRPSAFANLTAKVTSWKYL